MCEANNRRRERARPSSVSLEAEGKNRTVGKHACDTSFRVVAFAFAAAAASSPRSEEEEVVPARYGAPH